MTRTATDGVVGERKIFEESNLSGYSSLTGNNKLIADISIPTVGAMMSAISSGITAAAPTGTANTIANYDTNGALGSGIATYTGAAAYNATNDSAKIPTMAGVTAYAQAKIPARATKIDSNDASFAPSVVTNGTTAGSVGQMAVLTAARMTANDASLEDYDGIHHPADSTSPDAMIPTVAAVNKEIGDIWDELHSVLPTNTSGTIATYLSGPNNVGAVGGSVAIYTGPTQQNPYNATNDAAKVATAGFVETKQTKKVCVEWPEGAVQNDANCWLWEFPD